MKKMIFAMAALCIALVGCSKDKGGSNNNDRYRYGYDQYGYGGYDDYGYDNGGYGNYGMNCENARSQSEYNRCMQQQRRGGSYWGSNSWRGNNYPRNFSYGACGAAYMNRTILPGEIPLPVYYPGSGQTVCMGFTQAQYNYGMSAGVHFSAGVNFSTLPYGRCMPSPSGLICY